MGDRSDETDTENTESEDDHSDSEESDSEMQVEMEERTTPVQSLIIQAMDALPNSSLQRITPEELIAEEAQENIASMFLLTRVPTMPSWNDARPRQVLACNSCRQSQ
jgi:hypothetical protein